MDKLKQLRKIELNIGNLVDSPLYSYRVENNYMPVIGEGSLDASVVFIGEAPGKNEALTGKPFCGMSGRVLDELLKSIKVERNDVYITSIIKDRPPLNRDPKPSEIELYAPFLIKQLEIIQPKVIATLGRISMKYLMDYFGLGDKFEVISKIHGKIFRIKTNWGEVSLIPLYHPAVAVYNRNQLSTLKKDFLKIKKIINSGK